MSDINMLSPTWYDQLPAGNLRYMLKEEAERNAMLVRSNLQSLFRYEVEEETMYLLYNCPIIGTKHMMFSNYLNEFPDMLFGREEYDRIVVALRRLIEEGGSHTQHQFDARLKDGTPVTCTYSIILNAEKHTKSVVGYFIESAEMKEQMLQTIQELNQKVALLEAIRHTYETMIVFRLPDYSFTIVRATPEVQAAGTLTKSVLKLAELFCEHFVDAQYQQGFMDFVNEGTISERLAASRYLVYEYLTNNIGWCRARIMPVEVDSEGHVIQGIFSTELASAAHQEELKMLRVAASSDALTGLKNRRSGEAAINETLASGQSSVYLALDCDSFKNINDKLGHPVGDRVLIAVARALREEFSAETVMRLGGDEFVVHISTPAIVQRIQDGGMSDVFAQLNLRLNNTIIPELKGRRPSLSCGAVFVPGGCGLTMQRVYEVADKLLYQAKATHNGTLAYANMAN